MGINRIRGLLHSAREYVRRNRQVQSAVLDVHTGRRPSEPEPRSVRVLSYNIHRGVWTDGRRSLAPVCRLVSRYDIACLNEISRNQARLIGESLGLNWVSSDRSERGDDPHSNNAIFSRFSIEECRLDLLPYYYLIPWRRRILQATLNLDGKPLHVLAAHLSLLPGEVGAHLRCAGEALDGLRGPRILCGDLNAGPGHPELRQIAASYQDAWQVRGEGPGLTFGTRFAFRRIDYIFASGHFGIDHVELPDTRQEGGAYPSDHHPVAATLRCR